MIGDDLKRAIQNEDWNAEVFDRLNKLEKQSKALTGIQHNFMPGYKKLEHVKYGSAFPSAVATNQVFFRTDLGFLCYYDGTRWLTMQEYFVNLEETTVSATGNTADVWIGDVYDKYYTRFEVRTYVDTTNDGTHNWTVRVMKIVLADTSEAISSIGTSGDSPDTYVDNGEAADNATLTGNGGVFFRAVKNNAPGDLTYTATIRYRLIIT